MKILLAYISGASDRSDPYLNLVPSGLCYLHALLLQRGYRSMLANFSAWPKERIVRCITDFKPDIVGVSQWTHNRHQSEELAGLCRQTLPGCVVVFGGGHATFRYESLLTRGCADLVVLGEGEGTLLDIVERYSFGEPLAGIPGTACMDGGRAVVAAARLPLDDLDSLPFPAEGLDTGSVGIDSDLQAEFVLTTRGCPYSCHFCSSPVFWGKRVRFRSPAAIVAEMRFIRERYGLIYFSLRDDTFTADRGRVVEFCRMLTEQVPGALWNCQSSVNALDEELLILMKRAGCECVQLGVESGSPRILKRLGKRITPERVEEVARMIRTAGISLSVYLISDLPGEGREDTGLTGRLIRRIRPDDGSVSPLAYYPGTRLFTDAVEQGMVSAGIFEESRETALCAVQNGRSAHSLMRMFAGLPDPGSDRFVKQKSLLGYCSTTNILAGAYYENCGLMAYAAREYREITENDPANPWGWYLLAEACQAAGENAAARGYYRRVLELVPRHAPSRAALGMKKRGR